MTALNSSADPCVSSPCRNNGRCLKSGTNFVCVCNNNFYGLRCEFGDYCISSPCRNGGICQSYFTDYLCSCPTGYVGDNCQIQDPCLSLPCHNGGQCQSYGSFYGCRCTNNFVGLQCDIAANSQDLKPTTSNVSCAELFCPYFALIGFFILIIFGTCFAIVKKWKRRQRDVQLRSRLPDVSENVHSATRVSTVTSLSDHPTSGLPYNVRYTRSDSQTSTCVIEHISLSESVSNDVSPQQPHLHDNEESRPDGGSVNDHVRDLPPTYLSVVTDPRYIRDEGDSLQQLPSYDDVVAVMRPSPAPSDGDVTSIEVTS